MPKTMKMLLKHTTITFTYILMKTNSLLYSITNRTQFKINLGIDMRLFFYPQFTLKLTHPWSTVSHECSANFNGHMSIHPSVVCNCFIRFMGSWVFFAGVLSLDEGGYTLDKSPAHRRALTDGRGCLARCQPHIRS